MSDKERGTDVEGVVDDEEEVGVFDDEEEVGVT